MNSTDHKQDPPRHTVGNDTTAETAEHCMGLIERYGPLMMRAGGGPLSESDTTREALILAHRVATDYQPKERTPNPDQAKKRWRVRRMALLGFSPTMIAQQLHLTAKYVRAAMRGERTP
jgi:hypothetical protein